MRLNAFFITFIPSETDSCSVFGLRCLIRDMIAHTNGQNLSRDCSGVISAGETKKCTITNSYVNISNNVQKHW